MAAFHVAMPPLIPISPNHHITKSPPKNGLLNPAGRVATLPAPRGFLDHFWEYEGARGSAPSFGTDFVIFCTKSPEAVPMAKTDRSQTPPWTRFAGIGVEFAGAVAGFTVVGWLIDRHYNTGPWAVLIGVSLGLIGGMYNLIRESLKASRDATEKAQSKANTDGGNRDGP